MKKIIFLFLVWRIYLFLVAFAAPFFIQKFGARFPYYQERLIDTKLPHFIWSFGNFDGVHYLGIAKSAYEAQYTQAFFPLYPFLIKSLSFLTFGNLLISALILSNISFLIALFILYKLLLKTHNENIAFWSVLFLLAFPTSFYFGSVYTEGLFFLMITSSFYLFHIGKIWPASIIGAFSSATRLVGIFLAPTLVKKGINYLIPLLLVPTGVVSYMIYLKLNFNDPFYFLTSQSIFGQERLSGGIVLLPQVVFRYLKILATTTGLPLINAIFELTTTILAFALLLLSYKKVNKNWVLFSLLALITPTLTGTFASMPRYIIIAFPIYMMAAFVKSLAVKIALLFISLIFLTLATALFTQGYWVA